MSYRSTSGSPEPGHELRLSPQQASLALRSPSVGSDSTYSQYTTPRERSEASSELSRARFELAATTRTNARVVELRAALTASRRAERTRAAQLKSLKQDVKELMTLISGREDVLDRIDQLLDRSQARGSARDEYVMELQEQLADTRDQMAELCELHRMHVAKLDMEHELALDRLILKHESDLRMSEEETNDLRCELDARSEQLASLQNALDVITSPRSSTAGIHASQSSYAVFSLPATPARVSPSSSAGKLDKTSPLSALRAHNAALLKRLTAKDNDVTSLEVALLEEHTRVVELQDVISAKGEELEHATQELQRLRSKCTELEAETRLHSESSSASLQSSRFRASSTSSKKEQPLQTVRELTSTKVQAKPVARSRSSSSTSSKLVASKSASTLASSTRATLQSLASSASSTRKPLPKSMSTSQLPPKKGNVKEPPPPRARTASTTSSHSLKPAAKIENGASRAKATAAVPAPQRSVSTSRTLERRVPSRSISTSKPQRAASNSAAKPSVKLAASRNVLSSSPTLEDLTNSPKL